MRTRFCSTFLTAAAVSVALVAPALAQDAGVGESVGKGVCRFVAPGVDTASLPPSIALAEPLKVTGKGPVPAAWKATPFFYKSADGRFCVRLDTDPGTSLYGTGEVAGPLLRNGRATTCWNTDAYGYTEDNPSLYQSHPWVLAVRKDGTAFGVLADTTWRCEIDLSGKERGSSPAGAEAGEPGAGSIVFRGEGSPYSTFVIEGDTPQEVVTRLAGLIGTMPLPPKWALGYHQCRYSYFPEARVREIADGFRGRKIPCDVIWFDIDYMKDYRVFTFDKAHFPDVPKLNSDLGALGFHRIWMIDPGIKAEPGYAVYDSGTKGDHWVKTKAAGGEGEVYKGEVWPGVCVFPDYTRPETRTWWQGLYKDFIAQGVSGVWNDMNEPAVFNVKSKTMPEDNAHRGGAWDLGGTLPPGPHLQYHNVYGTLMAKGTFDGILAAAPEKRPFVLTRAGYIGSQRYAATWTGDNSAEWDDLEASISMVLNLGLSGQPFCGPDIGGFNGNGDGALFARWMGIGSLLPFSRGHTGKGNIDKEPWAFGPEIEQTCRHALERRYRLLPYLYTLFREASTTGLPVMRPLFFADPKDPALRSEDDAFLIGDDLLVEARVTPAGDRAVARPKLPGGVQWQPLSLVGEGDNPDLPRLYVRPGAIVPIGPLVQYTGEKHLKPLTLVVALDQNGAASGTLYEDEGEGFAYQRGRYSLRTYAASTANNRVKIEVASKEGRFFPESRQMRVMILKDGFFYAAGGMDGQSLSMDLSKLTPVKLSEFRDQD